MPGIFPLSPNFHMHQNHPEGLFKHRLLLAEAEGLQQGLRICIFNEFLGDGAIDPRSVF